MKTSLNQQEIDNFSKDSAHWWDVDGPFAPLHKLNPTRMHYIKEQIAQHYDLEQKKNFAPLSPLKGLTVADIGCGGGLVSESLARMGAQTCGLDADTNAINVARNHANEQDLKINYQNCTAEDFLNQDKTRFDVVCALEIIEHVDNPDFFVETVLGLVKPGGLLILSTLNRTIKSAALGIFAAEYILGLVPKGTHTHSKFMKPSEIGALLRQNDAHCVDVTGLKYSVKDNDFTLDKKDLSVNYFITAQRV